MSVVYKIRNKRTGLYSKGGTGCIHPQFWNKRGKTWRGRGPLLLHLSIYDPIPDDWVIEEYETVLRATLTVKELAAKADKHSYFYKKYGVQESSR